MNWGLYQENMITEDHADDLPWAFDFRNLVVYFIYARQVSTQASLNFLACFHLVILSPLDCIDASTQSKYVCHVLLWYLQFYHKVN